MENQIWKIAPLQRGSIKENEMSRRIYRILQRWIVFADKQYRDCERIPGSGHFFGGNYWYGMETAETLAIYAVLSVFGEYEEAVTGIPRDELKKKSVKALRYLGFTHDSGPAGYVREKSNNPHTSEKKWGGKGDNYFMASQTGRSVAYVGLAAWLLWDSLDDETKILAQNVVACYADQWSGVTPRDGSYYDTQCEENAWVSEGISAAISIFPEHPHREKWRTGFIKWAINSSTTYLDRLNEDAYEGRSLRWDWFNTVTLHPDFTTENHGFVHPSYLCAGINLRSFYLILSLLSGREMLSCALHNNENVYNRALAAWTQQDGLAVPIQGQDWWYGRHCERQLTHAVMNVFHNSRYAARLERNALEIVEGMQESNSRGCLLEEKGEECVIRAGLTTAIDVEHSSALDLLLSYLIHAAGGEGVGPYDPEEMQKQLSGVYYYPYGSTVVYRTKNTFSSFSWRNNVMALSLPAKGMWTVTAMYSGMVGTVSFRDIKKPKGLTNELLIHEAEKHGINLMPEGFGATAAISRGEGELRQYVAYIAMPGGDSVYVEQFVPLKSCEVTEINTGLIGIRNENYRAMPELAPGKKTLYLPDTEESFAGCFGTEPDLVRQYGPVKYLNVNNEIGYVLYGSNGVKYVNRHRYPHWKGVEDILVLNNIRERVFAEGESLQPFAAVILPNQSFEATAAIYERTRHYTCNCETTHMLEADGNLAWVNFAPEEKVICGTKAMDASSIDLYEGTNRVDGAGFTFSTKAKAFSSGCIRKRYSLEIQKTGEQKLDIIITAEDVIIMNLSSENAVLTFTDGISGIRRQCMAGAGGGLTRFKID